MAFVDGEGGDGEAGGGVGPPEAEGGVEREADEYSGGEVGAEQVLGAFAGGGAGSQALADAVLRVAELGMTMMLEVARPIPTQLVWGCSPAIRARVASCAM